MRRLIGGLLTILIILQIGLASAVVFATPHHDLPPSFIPPMENSETFSRFGTHYPQGHQFAGKPHLGIDYHSPAGSDTTQPSRAPVRSVADGWIVFNTEYTWQQDSPAYGKTVIIRHQLSSGEIVHTQYSHLDEIVLPAGSFFVSQGQLIGYEGMTGSGSYKISHLHFEIRKAVDLICTTSN